LSHDGYFARAARIVFGDRTFWWRVPVLSLINAVPIAGSLALLGYMMVMMRDAAWSTGRGLPSFSEKGEILNRGISGFVISLVWGLAALPFFMVAMIYWMASNFSVWMTGVPPVAPWWLGLTMTVPIALLTPLIYTAMLRSAIYLTMSAGLSLRGVRQLIAMNLEGFKRLTALALGTASLGLILAQPAALFAQSLDAPAFIGTVISVLSAIVVSLITIPLTLILAAAYGLWAGETNPGVWPPERSPSIPSYVPVVEQAPDQV